MARTSKKESVEAEVQVSAQEEQIEETQQAQENEEQETTAQNAPEVSVEVEKPAKPARPVREATAQNVHPKLVKIHAMESIDSIIAGKPYFLAKDRDHSVPSDVAAILVNGKKAYRI